MRYHLVFDRLLLLILLPAILPLSLCIYIIIRTEGYSPIFKQIRVGRNRKNFTLYKFRSMKPIAPETLSHQCPEEYYLKCASFIRRFKLDELPQLINVFNGSMSLIGPRPGLVGDNDLIFEREKRNLYNYHPGITGYSQIMNICMDDPVQLSIADEVTVKLIKKFIPYILTLFATILSSESTLKKKITIYLKKSI